MVRAAGQSTHQRPREQGGEAIRSTLEARRGPVPLHRSLNRGLRDCSVPLPARASESGAGWTRPGSRPATPPRQAVLDPGCRYPFHESRARREPGEADRPRVPGPLVAQAQSRTSRVAARTRRAHLCPGFRSRLEHGRGLRRSARRKLSAELHAAWTAERGRHPELSATDACQGCMAFAFTPRIPALPLGDSAWRRRRPESSTFYKVLAGHLSTYLEQTMLSSDGRGSPVIRTGDQLLRRSVAGGQPGDALGLQGR